MFFNRSSLISRSTLRLITRPTLNEPKPRYQFKRQFTSTKNPKNSIITTITDSYDRTIEELSINFLSQPIFENISYLNQTILMTLILRSLITLPISIWSKNRMKRLEEKVLPELKLFKSEIAKRAKRKFKSNEEIRIYQNSLKRLFRSELKRLQIIHKCKPLTTILGSITIHIPIIYIMTNVLRRSCEIVSTNPTHPLSLETSPILGESLIQDDLGLSIICWMAFLMNLEFNWNLRLKRTLKIEGEKSLKMKDESVLSQGIRFWNPDRIRNTGFFTGIFMMGYASFQPSLVLVYWLTSNSFSILQSLCFDLMDKRNQKKSEKRLNEFEKNE
ncbi:hypothetical protein DFH28DRAFT_880670 [Melampsora americana]|nr:hypothetical protein DFH28DRAFT_880670 [Melampsora americana]